MSGYVWFDTVSGEFKPILGRTAKVEMPAPMNSLCIGDQIGKPAWRSRTLRLDSKRGAEAIDMARRRIVYFGSEVFAKAVDAARNK